MPDTIASLQGQNEQGKMVFNHGKQYFILGRHRILVSEYFAGDAKPLDTLLEAAIRHSAKRSED